MVEKRYSERIGVSFNTERDLLKEFKELCYRQRKDMSEKINELMREELQKNLMGLSNPINIMFYHDIKPIKQEPLDKYLEENFVTSRHWFNYYSKIDDIDHVKKHEALAITISKQAKQRVNYLKTGRYLVQ